MMPYFTTLISEKYVSLYICPNCRKRFGVPQVQGSCGVVHEPGTCCHVGEDELRSVPLLEFAAAVKDGKASLDDLVLP